MEFTENESLKEEIDFYIYDNQYIEYPFVCEIIISIPQTRISEIIKVR